MKNHRRLPWVVALVMILGVTALGVTVNGCKEQGGDTRNIVDVVSLNGNQPLLSDVYNLGSKKDDPTDDFIPVDVIEVTFQSRPHDNALTIQPGEPFGSVRFYAYDLVWADKNHADGVDLDGNGSVDLKNVRGGAMNSVVPIGQTGQGSILVVSGGDKVLPPISCLGPVGGACSGNTAVEYKTSAQITFYGVEETSGDKITLTRGLVVDIGDYSDQ
jgi:hypothetical protein